jgi:hypothetical protein
MMVGEPRAFLAALPQKDGRYLAALTPGAAFRDDPHEPSEAMVKAIRRVADALAVLRAAGESPP